jgi:hypothetical protein
MTVVAAVAAPRRNFTRVDNRIIDDESLPGPARWVYTLLSRLTPGYRFDESWLMRKADLARNKVRAALRALEDRGLITRRQHNGGCKFGDVFLYVGDQPLPMDENPRADPPRGTARDQGKHRVSPGSSADRPPVSATTSFQDYEPQDVGGPVRDAPPRATPPTPQPTPEPGVPMPSSYRQTRLPIIAAKRRTGAEVEQTSPGTLVQITPAIRALAAIQHTTATITDEWLQRCHRRPPTSLIADVEYQVHTLVCDAIPDDDIRRGLAAWMAKGYAPSAIPSFVNQVMNARPLDARRQQPARRDLRAAAAVDIGERLQAAADARATG